MTVKSLYEGAFRRKCYDRAKRVDRGVPTCGPNTLLTENGTELLLPLISADHLSETLQAGPIAPRQDDYSREDRDFRR
jgi:hypothetical protein